MKFNQIFLQLNFFWEIDSKITTKRKIKKTCIKKLTEKKN